MQRHHARQGRIRVLRFFWLFFDFFLTGWKLLETKELFTSSAGSCSTRMSELYSWTACRCTFPRRNSRRSFCLSKITAGRFSKEQLIAAVWQDSFVEEGNLAKQISRLRKILNAEDGVKIETLPKHGYRFRPTSSRSPSRSGKRSSKNAPSTD